MRCSMQDIFNSHFDSYALSRRLHPRESRAAYCIRHCGTAAFGTQTLACPAGHFESVQHGSCRHRSCPRCSSKPRQLWIDSQLQRLLHCPHFHVVFTLPHVLLPLWSFNRSAMASLLFDCVRDSLLELMADPRRLGLRPGLLMALHTWGRNLSQHPHVHCLVSAGGIDPNGQWKLSGTGFLLPLKPLQALFRGKLLARLKALLLAQQLLLPPAQGLPHWQSTINQLYRAHWNIEIQPPYAHARGVALYLARYVKGGPVPADRALSMDSQGLVRMGYTDHRDSRSKTLCLHAHELIARVLWHAPPKGLHTVRYAGLYSSPHSAQYRIAAAALASAAQTPPPVPPVAIERPAAPTCPTCNQPLLARFCRSSHQVGENSFNSHPSQRPDAARHLRAARPNPSFKPTLNGASHWLAVQRNAPFSAA
jgi:Putative transposase/Transposase zinc-binding domain